MADLKIESVTEAVRDAFYVGVGAGVIAAQKLQVQRVELSKTLNTQLNEAKGSFENVSDLVEERLTGIEGRLETRLSQIEGKLPEQARDLVKAARELVSRAA